MPERYSFDYAIVRLVPRVERGECVNVGVILSCRALRFLAARVEVDPVRLAALAPDIDLAPIEEHLALIPRLCAGDAAAGPIGRLSQPERFHWLVAPRSTVIQISPAHSGLCDDPASTLDHLMRTLVRSPRPGAADGETSP